MWVNKDINGTRQKDSTIGNAKLTLTIIITNAATTPTFWFLSNYQCFFVPVIDILFSNAINLASSEPNNFGPHLYGICDR